MKDRVYEVVLSSGKKEEVVMEAAVKERIADTCSDALRKRMELHMNRLNEKGRHHYILYLQTVKDPL